VPPLREALTQGVDWAAVAAHQRKRVFAADALRPSAARLERLLAAIDTSDECAVPEDIHAQVLPDWSVPDSWPPSHHGMLDLSFATG